MDIRVRRHGRAHIDADRRRVDQFDLCDAFCFNAFHMCRQLLPADLCLQRRDQAFEHHRRLSRTGNARHYGKPSHRYPDIQRMHRMNLPCFQMYDTFLKHRIRLQNRADSCFILIGKERSDDRVRILRNVFDTSLGNHRPAICSGSFSHLNHPVGMLQNLCVMVDNDNGVPVRPKIVHHASQALEIIGVQADRRLIKNIENAGRAVADCPCELHALPFPRGKCRGCPIQRQVSKAEVHQPL